MFKKKSTTKETYPKVLSSGLDGSQYVLIDDNTRFDIWYKRGDRLSEIWARRRGVNGEVYKNCIDFKVLEFYENEKSKWGFTHTFNIPMLNEMVRVMKFYMETE